MSRDDVIKVLEEHGWSRSNGVFVDSSIPEAVSRGSGNKIIAKACSLDELQTSLYKNRDGHNLLPFIILPFHLSGGNEKRGPSSHVECVEILWTKDKKPQPMLKVEGVWTGNALTHGAIIPIDSPDWYKRDLEFTLQGMDARFSTSSVGSKTSFLLFRAGLSRK